jgi:4-hydroxybenzoyl-CoA thioesterase
MKYGGMKHSVRMTVRFGDVDAAGIVYYPNFFNYFHQTFEEFFGLCAGVPYEQVLREDRVGFPAVHLETDFKQPLRHGDVIDVEMGIRRIGKSSFTSAYRLSRSADVCATADIVTAVISLDTMRAIHIPEKYRRVLEQHLLKPAQA